jgi:hypothetical protein
MGAARVPSMGAAHFPRLGGRRGGKGRRPPRAAKLSAVPPRPDRSPRVCLPPPRRCQFQDRGSSATTAGPEVPPKVTLVPWPMAHGYQAMAARWQPSSVVFGDHATTGLTLIIHADRVCRGVQLVSRARRPGEVDHPAGDVDSVVAQTLVEACHQRHLHRHRQRHPP